MLLSLFIKIEKVQDALEGGVKKVWMYQISNFNFQPSTHQGIYEHSLKHVKAAVKVALNMAAPTVLGKIHRTTDLRDQGISHTLIPRGGGSTFPTEFCDN